MTHFTKLLYAGAGSHFQPVYDFPETKEFIFVDGQPFTEFGFQHFDRNMYRNKFMNNIKTKAHVYGFTITKEEVIDPTFFWSSLNWKQKIYYTFFSPLPYVNPTRITFENKITQQIVKYYVSTPLPIRNETHFQPFLNDLKSCDGLILCGHFPTSKLLDYLPNQSIGWIGYSSNCYLLDEYKYENEYEDNIFVKIMQMNEKERNQIFHSYVYIKDKVLSFTSQSYDLLNKQQIEYSEIETRENDYIISKKPQSDTLLFTSLSDFCSHTTNIS